MPAAYPRVLSEHATLDQMREGRSVCRYGDGELKLCLGNDIKSQPGDPDLAKALRDILKDPSPDALVCIPNISPAGRSPKELFWRKFRERKYTDLYDSSLTYGSAFITRPDSAPVIEEPTYWATLQAIWAGKSIVLARGSTKSLTSAVMPGATVDEIILPRQGAWSVHHQLFEELKHERRLVILCAGPTATVVAYRLARVGVRALDLGHVGMFLKRRMGLEANP